MSNNWVQIIGTLVIGGWLLNWVLPLSVGMFGMIAKPNELNEVCITLGGKIHRKWFFFNTLIYLCAFMIIFLLGSVFSNWIMFIILLPYLILLFILHWGNLYKRINAITDNHSFSKYFTICIAVFGLCSKNIYKLLPENLTLLIGILFILFWILVFVLPTKDNKKIDL